MIAKVQDDLPQKSIEVLRLKEPIGNLYSLLGNVEAALENLQKAIKGNPAQYRELAKTESDFNKVWGDERVRALIRGGECLD